MSIDATRWAWMQRVGRSCAKLVLLSIADRCGEDHTAFPSVSRLSQDTELDRKTVMSSTAYLVAAGFIEAVKNRGGKTTYRLIGVTGREDHEPPPKPVPKTGPVPKTVPVPKTGPDQSQKRDLDQYQKRDTNLSVNHPLTRERQTRPETSSESPPKRRQPKPFVAPTLEEVQAYVVEKRLSVDPRKFHTYFTEGDWHDSHGKPVLNWKQKALTWNGNDNGRAPYEAAPTAEDVAAFKAQLDAEVASGRRRA